MNRWTIGIYMAADEDIDSAGLKDLEELAQVKSEENFKILVQIDRRRPLFSGSKSWHDTRRYKIQAGKSSPGKKIISKPAAKLGELNTGDPANLTDFIKWIKSNKKTRNNREMLILWGHGHGWKGLCDDIESIDTLTAGELYQALHNARLHFDILAFDACLMSNLELLYEVKEYCDFLIAPEEKIPNQGWPYQPILERLKNSFSTVEVVTLIIDTFRTYYKELGKDAVLSGFYTGRLDALAHSLDELAGSLLELPGERFSSIKGIADRINRCTNKDYVDLVDLINELKRCFAPAVSSPCDNILAAYRHTLVTTAGAGAFSSRNGMSIYFPTSDYAKSAPQYRQLSFNRQHPRWLASMEKLYNTG